MPITGEMLIGATALRGTDKPIRATEAATGKPLDPAFGGGTAADVERACALAWSAFDTYRETGPEERARFLEAIAQAILDIGEPLIERCMAESGLPRGRLEGERGRTVGQLRLFAEVVREGGWIEARIDPALPQRQPLPRSDLRQRHIAVGPVAVFGASNFPLAFSVAGGDTASALAAGCPVVVKAHSAHPGTSELVGRAVQSAVKACGLPEGVFSVLFGSGSVVGQGLVADPRIKAVGFTGSRAGGTALMRTAAARPEPIPVYAEMSSINPVFLLPKAMAARAAAIGKALRRLPDPRRRPVLHQSGPRARRGRAGPRHLPRLGDRGAGRRARADHADAGHPQGLPDGRVAPGRQQSRCGRLRPASSPPPAPRARRRCSRPRPPTSWTTRHSAEEVFGAASLVIRCPDVETMLRLAEGLEGQLTATILMDEGDLEAARLLLPVLERKVGRILVNGYPTGVEVSHAMVHGGPYPSTSDGRSTSVGTLAIRRFLRPVCYQDLPEALLPEALREGNPLGLWRRLDGTLDRR